MRADRYTHRGVYVIDRENGWTVAIAATEIRASQIARLLDEEEFFLRQEPNECERLISALNNG